MAELDAIPSAARCRGARRPGPRAWPGWKLRGSCAATCRRRRGERWLLTSFDDFGVLSTGRGLPVDEVAGLLTAMAERTVCR